MRNQNPSRVRAWRIGREALWVAVGQALNAIGAIIAVRVVTGLISPEEYGTLALALTIGTLSQYLFFIPASVGPGRYLMSALEKGNLRSFLRATRQLVFWATCFCIAAGAVILIALALSSRSQWAALVVVSTVFALVTGIGALIDGLQSAARQRGIVAIHNGLSQWLRIVGAVTMVSFVGASGTSVLAGYAVGLGVVLFSQLFFFRQFLRAAGRRTDVSVVDEPHTLWRERMLRFGWPFALFGPAHWLQSGADRWAVEAFVNRPSVGYYSAAYQIGYQPVVLISNVVLQVIGPITYQWAGEGTDKERVARAHRLISVVVLILLLGTFLGGVLAYLVRQQLLGLLLDKRYQSAAWLVPWFVISAGLFTCGQAASMYHLSSGNPKALLRPKIITSLVGAALNLVGAAFFGLPGVVAAGVFFSGLYFVWMLFDANTIVNLGPMVRGKLKQVSSRTSDS